jgi:hypothetical protein
MQSYRCYVLDDEHHIVKVEVSDCADNDSALRWAKTIARQNPACHSVELWHSADLLAGWRAEAN